MPNQIEGNLLVTGQLVVGSIALPAASVANANIAANAAIERSKLAQDPLKPYPIPLTELCVWDAPASKLPTTPANDDLGLVAGTFGTDSITVQTGDCKAAEVSRYARVIVPLPAEYDAGQTVKFRISAAMLTTVADVQAILDMQVYKVDRNGGVSADICGDPFRNINSLTWADYDFEVVNTGLQPGDMLDARIYVYVEDIATATAVTGCIGAVELLCDVKG